MHNKILNNATNEQIREMAEGLVDWLSERDPILYQEAEDYMYRTVYGNHFSKWLLECCCAVMINEDGTTGAHWTLEDTNSVAKSHNIKFDKFNEYDWNYTMNMLYSDYYSILGSDTDKYCRMANKFLNDVDAPKGKAYIYYRAMENNKER